MLLVQLLEPKWYFIYITSTHAEPGTILRNDKTERLLSVNGFYVFFF